MYPHILEVHQNIESYYFLKFRVFLFVCSFRFSKLFVTVIVCFSHVRLTNNWQFMQRTLRIIVSSYRPMLSYVCIAALCIRITDAFAGISARNNIVTK